MVDCPEDPNFKTKVEIIEDEFRMAKIKGYKKVFADT